MAEQSSSLGSFSFKNNLFFYKKKQIKFLRLKLDNNGNFMLSIPYFYSFENVLKFLEQNQAWIENTKAKFKILSQNEVFFLGKKYELVIDKSYAKTRLSKGFIKTASRLEFENFLRKNARIIFGFYLKKWCLKTGFFCTHLSIKDMKTRWGSCNHTKKYINLNLRLLQKSLKAIEYVILHEISHLKYPNHSKEFYDFLGSFMQDYKKRELEFKDFNDFRA